MSSANNNSFSFFFPFLWMPFIYFSHLISAANTANTMLNRSGESGHHCLVPDLKAMTVFCFFLNICPMQYILKVFMIVCNSNLIGHLVFLFAKSGDTTHPMTEWGESVKARAFLPRRRQYSFLCSMKGCQGFVGPASPVCIFLCRALLLLSPFAWSKPLKHSSHHSLSQHLSENRELWTSFHPSSLLNVQRDSKWGIT